MNIAQQIKKEFPSLSEAVKAALNHPKIIETSDDFLEEETTYLFEDGSKLIVTNKRFVAV